MQNAPIIEINEQNVQKVIADSKLVPVLFYFWSDRDPESYALTAMLTKIVTKHMGKFILAKLNCDEHPMLVAQFGLQALPTFYLFENGQPVDGLQGSQSEQAIEQLLQSVLLNEDELILSEAKSLMENGEYGKAVSLLKQIYLQIPEFDGLPRTDICLLLASALLKMKQIEEAEQILSTIKNGDDDVEYQSLLEHIEQLKQAADSPEIYQLQKQFYKEPENAELVIHLAKKLHEVGRNEEALMLLFKPLERDVSDGKIKTAFMDLLANLGTMNSLAAMYRRKLYSLLY